MNLILIGPPGCGKGTQAQIISDKYNYLKVSTGDMLREEIKKDTEIGKKIITNMNDGKFVEDEIVNKLLEKIIFDLKSQLYRTKLAVEYSTLNFLLTCF